MKNRHSTSATIARGALALFGLIVIAVNAAVTWQFGTYYLNTAFGIQQPEMAGIAGGLYAILFLDVASLVWLFAYMRLAETSAQRGIALSASILAFVGSLLATTYMLASGTAGALSAYTNAVSTAAQVAMILIVVTHATLLVIYMLQSRGEAVTQTTINATTSATGEALTLAAQNVQNMVPRLAQDIGAAIETQILASLSFTRQDDGKLLYTPTQQRSQLPPPTPQDAAPMRMHATGTAVGTITSDELNSELAQASATVDSQQELFTTVWHDNVDSPQGEKIPTQLTRAEFNAAIQAAEREKAARMAEFAESLQARGNAANPTNGQDAR